MNHRINGIEHDDAQLTKPKPNKQCRVLHEKHYAFAHRSKLGFALVRAKGIKVSFHAFGQFKLSSPSATNLSGMVGECHSCTIPQSAMLKIKFSEGIYSDSPCQHSPNNDANAASQEQERLHHSSLWNIRGVPYCALADIAYQ
jgi:hypothetical protein